MNSNPLLESKDSDSVVHIEDDDNKDIDKTNDDNKYVLFTYTILLTIYGIGTIKYDVIISSLSFAQASIGLLASQSCINHIFKFVTSLVLCQFVTWYGIYVFMSQTVSNGFIMMWLMLQMYSCVLIVETCRCALKDKT